MYRKNILLIYMNHNQYGDAPYLPPDMFDVGRQEIGNDFKLWRVVEENGKKVWIHETTYIERLKQKIIEKEQEELLHLKKADNMLAVMLNQARKNKNRIQKEKEVLLKKHKKTCPPGKEVNPKTGRCVKKPESAKKPVKKHVKKPVKKPVKKHVEKPVKKQTKKCPPGKEVNPKTGRCVKKPTKKGKKVCEPGKKLNPKTNRCVKDK